MNSYIVVADKFVDFAVNARTITLRHLFALFELPAHLLPDRARLELGQGVSDDDCQKIISTVDGCKILSARWDIDALRDRPARAGSDLSHKRKPRNTLICPPHQVQEGVFHLDLRIDQDCELMDDHQTGQHVQGMILVEAARQAFLAVTEQFFLTGFNHKSYFVITSMNTEFMGFVFPLAAHMEYRIISQDINERRQRFEVEIDLIQGQGIKARTTCAFTVYPDQVISEKEAMLASQAVSLVHGEPLQQHPSSGPT
ncbi:MAG: AfsA-related hotdog domain-containing protein [Paracoccus sp. (in: a-proteobacteria)]|nr:AfsA-related hotdog domain-containing protein [Paracoccus sp. (in: a-proteobacteria)]